MTISFRAPPVNEVVIGKAFEPHQALLIPHYGLYWQLIQEQFPTTQHAAPIVERGESIGADSEVGVPLPRVWFVSEDKTRLLQLQNGRLYYNWRQTDLSEPYERFDSVYQPFLNYLNLFQSFFASQFASSPVWRRCDLTYVNVFRRGEGWEDFSDVSGLFSNLLVPRDLRLCKLVSAALRIEYELHEAPGRLVVSINPAKNAKTNEPALRVELAASSTSAPTNADDERHWFDVAHRAIVQSFCDITSPDMQEKYWRRIS